MRPFGSILGDFDYIDVSSVEGARCKMKNNFASRLAIKLLGIPHVSLRTRARKANPFLFGKKMLDAGCGAGVYSFTAQSKFETIDAVDISKEKIDYAKSVNPYKNISFQECDLCSLPFKDSSFDIILCTEVLEHIEDDKKALKELSRVLLPGGKIIVTVPNMSKFHIKNQKAFFHVRAGYSLSDMEKMCEQSGLKITYSEYFSFFLTELCSSINRHFVFNAYLLAFSFLFTYPISILAEKTLKFGEPNQLLVILEKSRYFA